jgi:hypothetical protein
MYERPKIEEYQAEWVKAERDLAIHSLQTLNWFPLMSQEPATDEDTGAPREANDLKIYRENR